MNRETDLQLLAEANKTLKSLDIKGKDYIPVSERIKAFRTIYPRGQILTEIIGLENGVVTMKASVYDDEGKLLATGHGQEKENSSFINKTSFIENCETSCVGRAIGNAGIGLDNGFASYEEVANAKLQQEEEQPKEGFIDRKQWEELNKMYSKEQIKAFYKELGISRGTDIPLDFFLERKKEWDAQFKQVTPEQEYY